MILMMILSAEPFELIPGFLNQDEGEGLLAELDAQVAWRDEYLQMFGRRVRSPRRVCWYGDEGVGYRYSGHDHQAPGWLAPLEGLRERLQTQIGADFNFALLNRYANHSDSMGWHADNEPELGPEPVIASVSLGATRTFLVRPTQKIPGVRRNSTRLPLEHGSLLVMRGVSQRQYQHSLPKSSQPCGKRLNLTFRHVRPASADVASRLIR